MAWVQSDLDALDTAIKSGLKRVRFKDHDTEFQSMDDMLKLRAVMKCEIEDEGGGSVIAAGRIDEC